VRAGLVQLTSSDDPQANLPVTRALVREAAQAGADLILTPEVTNCVSASRARQTDVLQPEHEEFTLAALRADAAEHGIWLLIGSLALKSDDPDGRLANRCFVIGPDGAIEARYDKIHMFDVKISDTESYRESAGYRPGSQAVLAGAGAAKLGLTICYDVRFPALFRRLATAGANILTVPSAFSPVTGAAHWHTLLQARAIETGCFVLAPAQTGRPAATQGRTRSSYGHSLAVSPWGRVLADGGDAPGVTMVDLDLDEVTDARARIPSLTHDRAFGFPL